MGLVEIMVRTGLVPSKAEARRLIAQGAVAIDKTRQQDINFILRLEPGHHYRMKIGKRKYAVVRLQNAAG